MGFSNTICRALRGSFLAAAPMAAATYRRGKPKIGPWNGKPVGGRQVAG